MHVGMDVFNKATGRTNFGKNNPHSSEFPYLIFDILIPIGRHTSRLHFT
jgi:hypothetical protein